MQAIGGRKMRNTVVHSPEPIKTVHMEQRLERVERKIDALIRGLDKKGPQKNGETMGLDSELDVMTLLSLPDHLRKSALAIIKFGDSIAEDVAVQTERSRAIESAYLNQLVRMGYLRRKRAGKRVYFSVGATTGSPKGVV